MSQLELAVECGHRPVLLVAVLGLFRCCCLQVPFCFENTLNPDEERFSLAISFCAYSNAPINPHVAMSAGCLLAKTVATQQGCGVVHLYNRAWAKVVTAAALPKDSECVAFQVSSLLLFLVMQLAS